MRIEGERWDHAGSRGAPVGAPAGRGPDGGLDWAAPVHHGAAMRLSVTLDPDLHQVAASRAQARGTTLSREINDLLRAALTAGPAGPGQAPAIRPEGRRRFPVSQAIQPFTDQDVARAETHEDLRHFRR